MVEKKREAAARERELQLELEAETKALGKDPALAGTDTMLDEFDAEESEDVVF